MKFFITFSWNIRSTPRATNRNMYSFWCMYPWCMYGAAGQHSSGTHGWHWCYLNRKLAVCVSVCTCNTHIFLSLTLHTCVCILQYHVVCQCLSVCDLHVALPPLKHTHTQSQSKQWLMALCNECKGGIVHFSSIHILVSGPGASEAANAGLSFPPSLQRQTETERQRDDKERGQVVDN